MAEAAAAERVVVSVDTDFGDLLAKGGDTLPRVILLRRHDDPAELQWESGPCDVTASGGWLRGEGRYVMLWLQVLVLVTIVVLFGVALAVTLRRGAAVSETAPIERKKVLAALGLLAAGAAFWLIISRDTGVDMPWTWSLSILLGLLALLVAARPRAGGRGVLLSAVAAPVIAVVGMALIYALGSGVSDGAGGTEPLATMAMVSVMGSVAAYTAPAVATAALLRPEAAKAAFITPGWYPDPVSPGSQRYWDGSTWTDQMRPAEERSDSAAAAG